MNKTIPPIIYRTIKIPYKICQQCGKEFEQSIRPNGYKESISDFKKKKYCSPECANRGLREYRSEHASSNPRFKRENKVPWNKGVYTSNSYSTIHKWLSTHQKKKGYCQYCRRKTRTTWANVTGIYERDMENFMELCYHCHNLYDRGKIDVTKKD